MPTPSITTCSGPSARSRTTIATALTITRNRERPTTPSRDPDALKTRGGVLPRPHLIAFRRDACAGVRRDDAGVETAQGSLDRVLRNCQQELVGPALARHLALFQTRRDLGRPAGTRPPPCGVVRGPSHFSRHDRL